MDDSYAELYNNAVASVATSDPHKRFTKEEDMVLYNFLITHPTGLMNSSHSRLWEEFLKKNQSGRSVRSLTARFSKNLMPNLPTMGFNVATMANLYMKYHTVPPEDCLRMMQDELNITLSSDGFIQNFAVRPILRQESSGPLIPRMVKPEPQEPQDEEMTIGTGLNPYHLGKREAHLEEEEEPMIDPEETDGGEELEDMPQQQEMPHLQQVVEQPMEQMYDVQEMVGEQAQYVPIDFTPLFEQMKKSIVEETTAAFKKTVEEVIKAQKKQEDHQEKTSLKEFLTDLLAVINNCHAPALGGIEVRINNALEELQEQDEMVPMDNIRVLLDMALKMMGY